MSGVPGNIAAYAPELILVLAALLLVILETSVVAGKGKLFFTIALVAILLAILSDSAGARSFVKPAGEIGPLTAGGMGFADGLAGFARLIILGNLILALLFDYSQGLRRERQGRYLACLMLASVGAMVLANAAHLAMLVLGVEILSIPLYAIAGFDRTNAASREAGLKYMFCGALASGFMVLGCAFYYAGAGTLSLYDVVPPPGGFLIFCVGLAMILAALLFTGGVFPFLAWRPDVLSGASGNAAGPMSALALLGSGIALMRIIPAFLIGGVSAQIVPGLLLFAMGTVLAGNLLMSVQTSVMKILIYASIAHFGYILIGLLALREDASSGALFYLATFTPVLVAGFYTVALFEHNGDGARLSSFAGAAFRDPEPAFVLAVVLASLSGLPLTAGFMSILMVSLGAVQAGLIWAVLFSLLASLIGAWCMLRVIAVMFMRESPDPIPPTVKQGLPVRIGQALTLVLIFVFGIFPAPLLYLTGSLIYRMHLLP